MNDFMHRICVRDRCAVLLVLVITAAMTIGGCTSPVKFSPATGSEKLPPYEGKVRILENLPPSGQYQRVGVLTVDGVQLTKEAAMVDAIKREAAARGADAVVMQGPIKEMTDASGGIQKTLAAWAIRLVR